MSTIDWLSAVNGNFSDASKWAGGAVPGTDDKAVIGAKGGAYTVRVDDDVSVHKLVINSTHVTFVDNAQGAGLSIPYIELDRGTALLNTANHNAHGTTVNGGTLEIGTGSAVGDLTLNGGKVITITNTTLHDKITLGGGSVDLDAANGTQLKVYSSWAETGDSDATTLTLGHAGGTEKIVIAGTGTDNFPFFDWGHVVLAGGTLSSGAGSNSFAFDDMLGRATSVEIDGKLVLGTSGGVSLNGLTGSGTIVGSSGSQAPVDLFLSNANFAGKFLGNQILNAFGDVRLSGIANTDITVVMGAGEDVLDLSKFIQNTPYVVSVSVPSNATATIVIGTSDYSAPKITGFEHGGTFVDAREFAPGSFTVMLFDDGHGGTQVFLQNKQGHENQSFTLSNVSPAQVMTSLFQQPDGRGGTKFYWSGPPPGVAIGDRFDFSSSDGAGAHAREMLALSDADAHMAGSAGTHFDFGVASGLAAMDHALSGAMHAVLDHIIAHEPVWHHAALVLD